MLSRLIKFILFNIIALLTFFTLFMLFTRLIVLNETFYAYSLERNGVYENLAKGFKSATREFLIGQLASSNDYNTLSLGQRQEIEKQVDNFISFINKDTVGNFVGVNVKNILAYLNNKSDQLYLYLPISDWNLPDEALNQIPEYLKTTDINVREILKNTKQDTPDNLIILEKLKSLSMYINLSILTGVAFQLFFLFLYLLMTSSPLLRAEFPLKKDDISGSIHPRPDGLGFLETAISKKGERYQSAGKLFSILGVLILILSWILFTAQNIFSEGLAFKTGWSELLAGTLVPIFAKPLVFTFTVYGLFILFTGIILYNKENKTRSL